jgi:arginyl-tRNA synthetase
MLVKAEIVPPGFINFFLKPEWLQQQVKGILSDKTFGANTNGKKKKILVESISANPTGPMTLGNGRGAFAGDTLANVLTMNGWNVWREYYLNDIGNQVNILAESVIRRYFQLQGIPTEYPDYCYQGDYVTELAKKLKLEKQKIRDVTTLRDKIKVKIKGMFTDNLINRNEAIEWAKSADQKNTEGDLQAMLAELDGIQTEEVLA